MKIKKFSRMIIVITIVFCILSGCAKVHTSKSLTFQVGTGDIIKVTLDTGDGYSLSQKDGNIIIRKDKETILQGAFLTQDMYDEKLEAIQAAEGISSEEGKQNNNNYLFYNCDGPAGLESDFLMQIKDTNTSVFLASLATQEEAKSAFERLQFE